MSKTGGCRQQKHTHHTPSTKTECDYLNGWIQKRSHMQKSHPKVVNPRDKAGERKKKKKKKMPSWDWNLSSSAGDGPLAGKANSCATCPPCVMHGDMISASVFEDR